MQSNNKISSTMMKPKDLAMYAIAYLEKKGDSVSNKKLQKLLYYIDAWHLVYFDKPIIKEEFEAWVYGPVLPSLYQELKQFGYLVLDIKYGKNKNADTFMQKIKSTYNLSDDQWDLIHDVLNKYGSLSSFQLEMLTHHEKPWSIARGDVPPNERCSNKISKKIMKKYYSKILDEEEKKQT